MPRLRVLSGNELLRIFSKFGFDPFSQRGSHMKLFSSILRGKYILPATRLNKQECPVRACGPPSARFPSILAIREPFERDAGEHQVVLAVFDALVHGVDCAVGTAARSLYPVGPPSSSFETGQVLPSS